MTLQQIKEQVNLKKSLLCVGLDTEVCKLPVHIAQQKDAVLTFNKAIIDATKDYCVSYKINTAFYEAMGKQGWEIMEETLAYIPSTHFTIADAKRGDIGNTSTQYAKAFFETLNFDAITVAPYMGEDSIRPFLEYKNKYTIVLGLTSNKGANDFELKQLNNYKYLYETVLETVAHWGTPENLMFVVGATQASQLVHIRTIVPQNFLLVPGVGAQGGSLKEVCDYGLTADKNGILVNASRAVLYASAGEDFALQAQQVAKNYQQEMSLYL